ncbi:prenylcysteine oxidase-like [Pollicipes pollicipes]|uniref:prenylcysteine oxidase-like n=1 Tax=Pollicipes pollicipes TaxID=41117 RepID=UPI00188568A6|nr:prenylcysteine oxidase-like [Pollicipes pollicipes]
MPQASSEVASAASAAYFVRQLFKEDADIQLYEQNRIGGRLDMEEVNDHWFESGGSIIHTKNKYMMDFIDKFGLQRRPDSDDTFGLCDGQQLLFVSSSWSFVTMAKLFWRYGYDVIKLQRLVSAMLLKFRSIYNLLDSGAAYDTVEDLIMAMDPSLIKLMGLPLSQYLK